jgi:hypothetical protein
MQAREAWEKAKKPTARHSAASKQRFFSAPLLDAPRETIALFLAQQFFSSLRFSYKRWTRWTPRIAVTANDTTVAD